MRRIFVRVWYHLVMVVSLVVLVLVGRPSSELVWHCRRHMRVRRALMHVLGTILRHHPISRASSAEPLLRRPIHMRIINRQLNYTFYAIVQLVQARQDVGVVWCKPS